MARKIEWSSFLEVDIFVAIFPYSFARYKVRRMFLPTEKTILQSVGHWSKPEVQLGIFGRIVRHSCQIVLAAV
jgi:hypothetical protein